VHFGAIGDTVVLPVHAIDEEGNVVPAEGVRMVSRNSSVVVVNDQGIARSKGNGVTNIVAFAADGGVDSVRVTVLQATDSLLVSVGVSQPIISLPAGATLPISCRTYDRAGALVPATTTVTSASGLVTGTDCHSVHVLASGFDTLTVGDGSHQSVVPLVIAILPSLATDPSLPLPVDSLPSGVLPWAPTLYRDSQGELELYFTGYVADPTSVTGARGSLHRLVSTDDLHFAYSGVALRSADSVCHPEGTGIENIAIVPRAEAAGWRMFYAAGGYDCYGWQVFSAVSNDERTWVKEAGARISNGGKLPPFPPVTVPWPSGEGMVVDRLDSGAWRMLVGAYEHVAPQENKFQIIEWDSPDQLSWRYVGPVLTTREVGTNAHRSVYSPAVQEITPGLYRMFFTGDNLDVRGGRSRLYTAVSRDKAKWQIEGELLADPNTDYFYSTLVDNLLVFIRQPVGQDRALGMVLVTTR
jgi:hypothetical protein